MSKAAAPLAPSSLAMVVAIAGVWCRWVTVETITVSIWPASMPARSRALRAAATDIIWMVSSGAAQRRSTIPDRVRIHSSVESIIGEDLGVVDHPPRPVAADAEDGGGLAPVRSERCHVSCSG